MRLRPRNLLILLLVAAGLMLALAVGLYLALHHVPAFYAQRTETRVGFQRSSGEELERTLLALHDDTQAPTRWQAVFTEDQINAWLASELPTKFPGLLPAEFQDPRVAFESNQMLVACRYTGGPWSTVLNLRLEVELADNLKVRVVKSTLLDVRSKGEPVKDEVASK